MVQQPAADARDQVFVVTGLDGTAPGGGSQKCRLHGSVDLLLRDLSGEHQLASLKVPFDATVGGGNGPLTVRVRWSNWCPPDHHAALATQFSTDDSSSSGTRSLTNFPDCRDPALPTSLRRS